MLSDASVAGFARQVRMLVPSSIGLMNITDLAKR
jgi:hypothetical protein